MKKMTNCCILTSNIKLGKDKDGAPLLEIIFHIWEMLVTIYHSAVTAVEVQTKAIREDFTTIGKAPTTRAFSWLKVS